MQEENNRIYLLSKEKVSKALLKLGIPTMIGMMTSALYNLVDAYFVAGLGTSQMGAVAVVFPLSLVILGVGLLFGSGASSYLARLLGDKKYKEADKCASTALFTSIGVGTVFILSMLMGLMPLLRILGTTDTILPYAKGYAELFIIGLLINIFNITINNIATAEGATMLSMAAMLAGGIANIILDPILIYVVGLGVNGAAIATLLSRCISASIFIYYIVGGKSVFHFSIRNIEPSKKVYGEIFKVGIPMLVYQLLTSVTLSITNLFAAHFGDFAIASMGVVSRLTSLGGMMIFGFLKGYQPFVGYNYGAGNMERVKKATRITLLWTTIFCGVFSLLLVVFANQIMHAFSKDDVMVIHTGSKALIVNGIVFLGLGFQVVYSSMFLALGRAKEGGMISVGRQGAFFIPLIFLLTALFHLNGLILAQPVADLCSIIMVFILKTNYEKETKKEGIYA